MRVEIQEITPAKYARVGYMVRKEVAQLVDTVVCRPRVIAMSVQAIDCNNAAAKLAVDSATEQQETYSTIGLVPSATTCRPCATAIAASADGEDSATLCLYVSAREAEGYLEDVPSSLLEPKPNSRGITLPQVRANKRVV